MGHESFALQVVYIQAPKAVQMTPSLWQKVKKN